MGIVKQYGYTAEEYSVKSLDGYILTLHRISGSPRYPKRPGKPAVFLQHGVMGASDVFTFMGPKISLCKQDFSSPHSLLK